MLLKLALNRLNYHKNKKIELSALHKSEVKALYEQGKEPSARVMVRLFDYYFPTKSRQSV